jgi:hypothetical protein
LYGFENWSVTVRVVFKIRVFENRVLRKTFGLQRNEVTGDWRILHNEELYDSYSSPNIRYVRMGEARDTCMGGRR